MIEKRPYDALGQAQLGWLAARYHFSFAGYHDPNRMGMGQLRVVNDDTIDPHTGFDFHPHEDMEIITYVREGAITHEDSLGNKGVTKAGHVQVMSAGTGIVHGEWNREATPTRLYQIWIRPDKKGHAPRWETRPFPKEQGMLSLLVADPERAAKAGALYINQQAAIWGGVFGAGQHWEQSLHFPNAYLLISQGKLRVNGVEFSEGDGAVIVDEASVSLDAIEENTEIVLIEVPNL